MARSNVAETLAVLVAQVSDARSDINGLRSEVAAARTESVSRGEWLQRNAAVDTRFGSQGGEVGELRKNHASDFATLRAELNSKRAPWWSVVSLIIAAGACVAAFGPLISAR